MKYYVLTFANGGLCRHGEFENYYDALEWAERENCGSEFTLEEYESEEDYYNNL